MTALDPVAAIAAASQTANAASAPAMMTQANNGAGFGSMLSDGLHRLEARVAHADQLVAAFATDDSIPVHQVTIALEQARLSVELALQVRNKAVGAYQQMMGMHF